MEDYTKQAEMALAAYMKQHGPTASMSLDETSKLIAAARKEKEDYLRTKANQQHANAAVGQQRESVGILPDRDAHRILRELNKSEEDYVADAKAQAQRYCQSRNAGSTPKSFDADDANEIDIRNGVVSWIESKRKKNWFKKTN